MGGPEHVYRQAEPRRAVICPTCQRPVEIDREDTAVCSNCDARFATRDATTLVEYSAMRNLARALDDGVPAPRGMSSKQRWAVTGGVLGTIAALSAAFGFVGFAVSGGLALFLLAVAGARTGGGMIR